jgi:hypothetical protein
MHPLNLDLSKAFSLLIVQHKENGGLILEIMGKALEAKAIPCTLKAIGRTEHGKWRAGRICLQVEDDYLWSGKGEAFLDWDNALVGLMQQKVDISNWNEERSMDLPAGAYPFAEQHSDFLQALGIEIARRDAWVMERDTPTPRPKSPHKRL